MVSKLVCMLLVLFQMSAMYTVMSQQEMSINNFAVYLSEIKSTDDK